MKTVEIDKLLKRLAGGKYVLAVLILGIVLLLLPGGEREKRAEDAADPLAATGVSLEAEGEKLSLMLAEISGVGRARVLLSAEGSVIVCDGADSAAVRLQVTDAVMAYTGLGSDKIAVLKMK